MAEFVVMAYPHWTEQLTTEKRDQLPTVVKNRLSLFMMLV